ncbi:MAG: NOB1 family endonuclease [Candidatus Heimdallarchaeaceae archaeon]
MVSNNNLNTPHTRKYIIDSTLLIHILPNEWPFNESDSLILPAQVIDEMKSFQSKSILELLKEEKNVMFTTPSKDSLKKVMILAKKTGDFNSLSQYDLQILALALDYPNYIILSDDHAIQNVGRVYNIKVQPYFSKITKRRSYYWKCVVCGEKYNQKIEHCVECGSPVKRYFRQKNLT